MARLTTHVLDTSSGRPAAGLRIDLVAGEGEVLASAVTNADGRLDRPLVDEAALKPGRYELRFHVAAYFRACGIVLPEPPFLDVVPIAFGIAEPDGRYHVPLLISPFGYTTYRGS